MSNKDKYDQIFVDSFSIEQEALSETLEYNSVDEWDSIGHMELIASLEEEFNISLDMDDIIGFSSYVAGFDILKRYGVMF